MVRNNMRSKSWVIFIYPKLVRAMGWSSYAPLSIDIVTTLSFQDKTAYTAKIVEFKMLGHIVLDRLNKPYDGRLDDEFRDLGW